MHDDCLTGTDMRNSFKTSRIYFRPSSSCHSSSMLKLPIDGRTKAEVFEYNDVNVMDHILVAFRACSVRDAIYLNRCSVFMWTGINGCMFICEY